LGLPEAAHRIMSHTASNRSIGPEAAEHPVAWVNPELLPKIRSIILGLTLFIGLLIWVAFSVGVVPRGTHLVVRLQALGVMTWIYALVQIIDMKVWRSRFARRRRQVSRIPEAVEGWLFGQMLAWFGLAYYGLTDDARWFAAGVVLLVVSFVLFPISGEA
jgi:hypothetical protein